MDWHLILGILITMVFSAFFSGMEIAFVASNRMLAEMDKEKNGLSQWCISLFYKHPNNFVSTMLVGNNIALVVYSDGVKAYILHPQNLKVGDKVISGVATDIKIGNCLELQNIPEGTFIHNVELQPGKGGQLCRAAGTSAQILGSEGKYVIVRLASGEVRKLLKTCRATIGIVGNEDWKLVNLGKAGKSRWNGVRPTVRGSAMNPVDHPHGGGEGKCPVGRDAPRSPWGKRVQGVKTRRQKKNSTRLIVRRASK